MPSAPGRVAVSASPVEPSSCASRSPAAQPRVACSSSAASRCRPVHVEVSWSISARSNRISAGVISTRSPRSRARSSRSRGLDREMSTSRTSSGGCSTSSSRTCRAVRSCTRWTSSSTRVMPEPRCWVTEWRTSHSTLWSMPASIAGRPATDGTFRGELLHRLDQLPQRWPSRCCGSGRSTARRTARCVLSPIARREPSSPRPPDRARGSRDGRGARRGVPRGAARRIANDGTGGGDPRASASGRAVDLACRAGGVATVRCWFEPTHDATRSSCPSRSATIPCDRAGAPLAGPDHPRVERPRARSRGRRPARGDRVARPDRGPPTARSHPGPGALSRR